MIKFRLNERNINRLIVLLALLAPWLYLFGSYFAYLCGAHGSADVPNFEAFFYNNMFYQNGVAIVEDGVTLFFAPFDQLLNYVANNMFGDINAVLGYPLIGFASYAFGVVVVDLIAYIALFIPRIFKKVLHTLEGGSKND